MEIRSSRCTSPITINYYFLYFSSCSVTHTSCFILESLLPVCFPSLFLSHLMQLCNPIPVISCVYRLRFHVVIVNSPCCSLINAAVLFYLSTAQPENKEIS